MDKETTITLPNYEEILTTPVEQVGEKLEGPEKRVISILIAKAKSGTELTLEENVEAKANALVHHLCSEHATTALANLEQAMTALFMEFGQRQMDAFSIYNFLAEFTQKIHMRCLELGHSFEACAERYGIEEPVLLKSYENTKKYLDLEPIAFELLKNVAEKTATGQFPDTNSIVTYLLAELTKLYAAHHIAHAGKARYEIDPHEIN